MPDTTKHPTGEQVNPVTDHTLHLDGCAGDHEGACPNPACDVALLTEDTRCQLPAGHDGYHQWDPKLDDQRTKSLVERLRKVADWDRNRQFAGPSYHALLTEAADEIEHLRRSRDDAYQSTPAIAASVAAAVLRGELTPDESGTLRVSR